ncbi:extracellular mutant protein 11-domain-containing protein [Aspergillus lucknowensis]|uniref:Extracellular mutant protein 11-domain-containing protein n=1 Tax=Aspergillus lucknowensis TaxID=176173 RepID=A0ABR4M6Y2_9EURO
MAFVPSASAFALPLPLWQQSSSVRVAKYEYRKRKRYDSGEGDSEDSNDDNDGRATDVVSELGVSAPSVILSPDEAHQRRVAGLSPDEELPRGHFPHGAIKEGSRKVNNRHSILKQLSSLSPPIYAPQSAAYQGNIRLHHLAVLTSILHRCLLDGDFIRAGRAWGLIIREKFSGHSIDVRTEDRWGIGAEILLRKSCQSSRDLPEGHGFPRQYFTRKGFEDAKLYYETLIVEHPYQKTMPNAISPLHFYPAMFGLWIYATQEESISARRQLEGRDPKSFRDTSGDEDVGSDSDSSNYWRTKYHSLAASIRANELTEAQKIAARVDEIIASPPYSDSPELLELRSMVSLWIADLLVSSLPARENNEGNHEDIDDRSSIYDSDNDFMSTETQPDSIQARRARRLAMEKRQTELEKSQEFMEKARRRKQGHQPRANESSNQSRQALAEQARVEVPATTLVAPVPISANRHRPVEPYASQFHEPLEGQADKRAHKDAFDTDVEGIDESTIAATSVIGVDEIQYRFSPSTNANAQQVDIAQHPPQASPSPSPPRNLRNARRIHDSKWYEGLGDRALKSAGFDLDEVDDASQLTSAAGDDEQSNDTDDQRYVPRYSAVDEPLSRRLQSFWTASRNTYQSTDMGAHVEPSKNPSYIPVPSAPKALPASSSKKVMLTRSMTTTPRTRFSPPKPSLLDQLDLTPTRRSPNLTRTQSRKERERDRETSKAVGIPRNAEEGLGLFKEDAVRPDSMQSLNVFDMTNFDDLENDSSMNDPFSRRTSIRRNGTDTSNTKKRHLEPDYPPEILCTKSFAELQAEPFDKTPTPNVKETEPQLPVEKEKDEDKVSFLLRLSENERAEYFAKLSVNEWEEHGDLLIERFSKMMSKMKELRHARRKTASIFEAEIKRRNELVEEQSAELASKFEEMRAGGAEVLRGRSP